MKISSKLSEKEILAELCERIKQYRIASDMTQAQLADKAFVSVGTLVRLESGKEIGLLKLIQILKALGLDENIDLLLPDPQSRPSYHLNASVRQRVKKPKKQDPQNGWKWGDEK